ncbi:MAG: hypothetical protein Q7J48_05680 [Nocardioides sp.]|nr:hypothetical protein [Nocardioides sp.]
MSRREAKVRIRAWLEERELDGLSPELRAKVEVERQHTYESVQPPPRSVGEIHDTLDRLFVEAGLTDADEDHG